MTKKELVDEIMDDLPETSKMKRLDVEYILESLGKVSAAELLGGGGIPFPKLGKLKVRPTAARTGRNPQTGESLEIPAGRKIVFSPFKELKDALK